MAGFASSQISSFNEGEEAFKNQIVPGSKLPQSGGDGGGMGGNIDNDIKLALGGGIDIGTGSLGGVLSIFNGNGGVFENSNIFEIFDGAFLALGKISYHDFFEMAKKKGLKLDVSVVKETGADLGANLSISSSGQGQSQ
jgi:hypothetical protein